MKINCQRILSTILVIISSSLMLFCGKTEEKKSVTPSNSQNLSNYIYAFTSGEISKGDSLQVVFSKSVAKTEDLLTPLSISPLTMEPEVKGTATWLNATTLEFKPDRLLRSGTSFTCKIHLKPYFQDIPEDLEEFVFNVYTPARNFEINIDNLRGAPGKGIKYQELTGTILTSDLEEDKNIETILTAKQDRAFLPITWKHSDDGKQHLFTVSDITRKQDNSDLTLKWNGNFEGYVFSGEKMLTVPSLSYFAVQSVQAETEPEQHISVCFTDPLLKDQDLQGLIYIENHDLRFLMSGNEIKVYSSKHFSGKLTVRIEPGIKNIMGAKFQRQQSYELIFDEINPALRLTGKKVIIPNSTTTLFPFEAVNISAVDLQITKIYEHNIPQFLQVNSLDGNNEMYRVGERVLQKKVALDPEGHMDLKKWNRHILDLTSLVKLDPGAIYQISLAFRPSYSLYTCDQAIEEESETYLSEEDESDPSFWDYYQNQPYYSYRYRNDPCHKAYYGKRTMVHRNVLASDLGIIAKSGKTGKLLVMVTSLLDCKPVNGARLELYNYKQKMLMETITNHSGQATIDLQGQEPFLLIAKKSQQRGYLKLQDGLALTLSRFDVGGTKIKEGVNGFIYGDRGVWRPGDQIYLNFILYDKNQTLPKNHPVSFELRNPNGDLIIKRNLNEDLNGFYPIAFRTDDDAITGNYSAKILVGGSTFTKNIKIETIKPNRLKINFKLNEEELSVHKQNHKASLDLLWLHGAVAQNLQSDIQVRLAPTKTAFNRFEGFRFDDPIIKYYSEDQEIFKGKVDEKGHADVVFSLHSESHSPGMLNAHFICKAYEPSGEFSIDRFSVKAHPYETYVGIKLPKGDKKRGMLLTDKDHQVEVITVNSKGEPVSKKGLIAEVYKLSWKWWWDQSGNQETQYRSQQLTEPISVGSLDTNEKGEGVWKFRINYPDWGRYLVRIIEPGGHITGQIAYIDWPGWAGRQREEQPGGAAMLNFTVDKERVNAGEPVTLSIPSSASGRILISIESGQEVLSTHWVEAQAGETHFTFETTEEMTPNIYVNVTLIQPHAQTANDLPIRLYGVLPVLVENPDTKLHPLLQMPDIVEPENQVSIEVSETNGKPMTYTLAMVDEGLLDLTRFSTPNPWQHFYARQALMVKTWDMYDWVLGAFGGEMKALLSIGGGASGGKPGVPKANRFKPMVLFKGPFYLESGQKKVHRFRIPNYIGSVRTMLVAGDGNRFGSAEKTTPVRKPLMLLGTLPRVLSPGEQINFPLTVFALEEHVKNVQVHIEPNEFLLPQGSTSQNLSFSQTGDQVASFPLTVANKTGIGKIKAVAVSGSERAEFEIEIDVRNPNPYQHSNDFATVSSQQNWKREVVPVGMKGTNTGYLELSSTPPLNLSQRLDYLIHYPHGCVEQTTSAVFPQLYLSQLMELSKEERKLVEKNIKDGIARIRSFQQSSGGLGYWPGDNYVNDWGTSYAGHFMLSAREKGYAMPANFISRWINYQKVQAGTWTQNSKSTELMQAYRLYLLAYAEKPQIGAMNRFKESGLKNVLSKWLIAAAYYRAGQQEIARELAASLPTRVQTATELSGTYGSTLRDEAIILECMVSMSDERAADMAQALSKKLNDNKWYNTQALGFTLTAMGKFSSKGTHHMNFSVMMGSAKWDDYQYNKPVARLSLDVEKLTGQNLVVKNNQKTPLYLNLFLKGQPAAGTEMESSNDLKLLVEYKDASNRVINPVSIRQGTDFKVYVTIVNPGGRGNYQEVSLCQIFPSGWEIHNPRMIANTEKGIQNPKYRDIRDDRVYSYFDLPAGKSRTYLIHLNAAYLGRFYLPAIHAEAMYDQTIHAQQKGQWVDVIPAR